MEEQRQHLDHVEIRVEAQSCLKDLCDAIESMDEKGWTAGTTMDTLNEEKLKNLIPVIKSLIQTCKFQRRLRGHIYRFKRPHNVTPSGLNVIIPLYISEGTKPVLSAEDPSSKKLSCKELIVGNMYWLKDSSAHIQPEVVLLWLGSPKE